MNTCVSEYFRDTYKEKLEDIVGKTMTFFCERIIEMGFEGREGQEDMALDIAEAMRDKQHIVVGAGVGIGKSFAYLVPLILYNKCFKKPVIISTS